MTTWRDRVGREAGGGFKMEAARAPMANSC